MSRRLKHVKDNLHALGVFGLMVLTSIFVEMWSVGNVVKITPAALTFARMFFSSTHFRLRRPGYQCQPLFQSTLLRCAGKTWSWRLPFNGCTSQLCYRDSQCQNSSTEPVLLLVVNLGMFSTGFFSSRSMLFKEAYTICSVLLSGLELSRLPNLLLWGIFL